MVRAEMTAALSPLPACSTALPAQAGFAVAEQIQRDLGWLMEVADRRKLISQW